MRSGLVQIARFAVQLHDGGGTGARRPTTRQARPLGVGPVGSLRRACVSRCMAWSATSPALGLTRTDGGGGKIAEQWTCQHRRLPRARARDTGARRGIEATGLESLQPERGIGPTAGEAAGRLRVGSGGWSLRTAGPGGGGGVAGWRSFGPETTVCTSLPG